MEDEESSTLRSFAPFWLRKTLAPEDGARFPGSANNMAVMFPITVSPFSSQIHRGSQGTF